MFYASVEIMSTADSFGNAPLVETDTYLPYVLPVHITDKR